MESALQILSGIVSLICLAGGTHLLVKGVANFLPGAPPAKPLLDNIFRFLSAIYLSMGFLMAWVAINMHQVHELNYLTGIVVICAGLGRLYSRIKVGSAGKYTDYIMLFEIILGISIALLQFFR